MIASSIVTVAFGSLLLLTAVSTVKCQTCVANTTQAIIDCRDQNVAAVPNFRSREIITSLDLSNNPGLVVAILSFAGMKSLTILKLQGCGLTTLPSAAFQDLFMLTTLDLSRNSITSVPEVLFSKLVGLKHLNLTGNNATNVVCRQFCQQEGFLFESDVPSCQGENFTAYCAGTQPTSLSPTTSIWTTVPFIYGLSGGGFLIIVAVGAILVSQNRKRNRLWQQKETQHREARLSQRKSTISNPTLVSSTSKLTRHDSEISSFSLTSTSVDSEVLPVDEKLKQANQMYTRVHPKMKISRLPESSPVAYDLTGTSIEADVLPKTSSSDGDELRHIADDPDSMDQQSCSVQQHSSNVMFTSDWSQEQ